MIKKLNNWIDLELQKLFRSLNRKNTGYIFVLISVILTDKLFRLRLLLLLFYSRI